MSSKPGVTYQEHLVSSQTTAFSPPPTVSEHASRQAQMHLTLHSLDLSFRQEQRGVESSATKLV